MRIFLIGLSLLVLSLFFPQFSYGQISANGIPIAGDWQAYLSQSEVAGLTTDQDGNIWVATQGGIFVVEGDEIKEIITPLDGLYRPNPRQIIYNKQDHSLWLGYDDGTLQSLNIDSRRFQTFTDIRRADRFSIRGINAFQIIGNALYIATDFGVVIFDMDRGLTLDSYFNLGSFAQGIRVFDIYLTDDRMYLSTASGLAVGDLNDDLNLPENWNNITDDQGFSLTEPRQIRILDGFTYVRNNEDIRFAPSGDYNNNWQSINNLPTGNMTALEVVDGSQLWVAHSDSLIRIDDTNEAAEFINTGDLVTTILEQTASGQLVFGSFLSGLGLYGSSVSFLLPDGPYLNLFADLKFSDGVLVAASSDIPERVSSQLSSTGFYRLTNEGWENYNIDTRPDFVQPRFRGVFRTTSSGRFDFFGSWGRGVAVFDRETGEIQIYNSSNSPLRGESNQSGYAVIVGMATDRNGQLWNTSMTNNIMPLYNYDPEESEWRSFPRHQDVLPNEFYETIFVDRNNVKWIGLITRNRVGRGLLVLRTFEDGTQEGVVLTTGSGSGSLPNDRINAIVQDKRGEIWIGTDRGIARFAFPDRIIDGSNQERQAAFLINADPSAGGFLLRDAYVTSIVVDGANRKWVGTRGSGVWVIEEDGGRYRVVKQFTEANSPLLSDDIQSLAINEDNGMVFIATALGLVSYTSIARSANPEMSSLFIYPNPYSYSRESGNIIIDQLSAQTRVSIVGADGRLIRRLETRGGRVEWDVRDGNGNKVPTGVYLIIANEIDGDRRGVGRVVIIR